MDQIIPSNIPNLTLLCRLCLCEDVYMFPIFNETNIYLPQRIAACVNVEVYKTDSISTLICKQCLKKINDWHEFKQYCSDSQSKLHYWSSLRGSNDPIVEDKNNYVNIKEEIVICDEEEIIISDNVEDIQVESIETCYEDYSYNDEFANITEETDPVSTTMYFAPDEHCEIEPEPETLLVPTRELSPDAHGSTSLIKKKTATTATPNTTGIVNLKIEQVYRILTCRICDTNFSSLAHRSRHERLQHMVNFKEIKCFACNLIWNEESELLDHFHLNHSDESTFFKSENKVIENGCAYVTVEKSHQYLKEFAENLNSLRNNYPGAKKIALNSFEYYNQCIQKIIDRNSIDANISFTNVLDQMLEQNLIIKNTCHQCCISFKHVGEFQQHISKRYCKKRVRLVESGEIKANQHFKCIQCDRIFGCLMVLTHHIKSEHIVEKVPEKCHACHKCFQSKHEYNTHVQETCSYQIYCSICELVFNTTDAFKLHCNVHIENDTVVLKKEKESGNRIPKKDWKNQCCLCPKVYRYYQDLQRHFKKQHFKFDMKTCLDCGDNFLSDIELLRHRNALHLDVSTSNHNPGQKYFCDDCNSVFRTLVELEQHKTIHSDSNSNSNEFSDSNTSFPCTICVKSFDYEEELKQHIITVHRNGKTSEQIKFRCMSCKKTFNTNKSLVDHNIQIHSIILKKQGASCLKCNKSFKNAKSINYHLKKNHCVLLKKQPPKGKMLKIKTEVKVEADDYDDNTCIVCKKMFASKKSLVSHAKLHFPFTKMHGINCQLCNKTCESVEELLDHFKCHSSKSLNSFYGMTSPSRSKVTDQEQNDNENSCEICNRSFATRFGLTMHFVLKHGKRPSPLNCVICKEGFQLKTELIGHVREHIKNNHKFLCVKCNQSFLVDAYLSHMSKIHSTNVCVLCNKRHSSLMSLVSHKGWHFR